MKLLWLSRHPLTGEQLEDLHRIYGADLQVDHKNLMVNSATDVMSAANGYDVVAAVLPVALSLEAAAAIPQPMISSQTVSKRSQSGEFSFQHCFWYEIPKAGLLKL